MVTLLYVFIDHMTAILDILKNLELITQKIQSRNKKPLLCGDWNLNSMVDNRRLQELQNLLEIYDMTNKISPSTETVRDVIITNNDYAVSSTSVVDLGLSHHLTQIVRISNGKEI
jgi:hypothetical protein